jgi:hypothetical protein
MLLITPTNKSIKKRDIKFEFLGFFESGYIRE